MTGACAGSVSIILVKSRGPLGEERAKVPERNTPSSDFARVLRDAAPYLGIGTALAATVGGFFALGLWLDGMMGTKPALSLLFGSLGVVLALVQFVRMASKVKPKP